MLPIHHILLPVDFSERCLKMTADAKALAEAYTAEITLLHVVNPMYSFPATAISGPAMVPIPASVIAERQTQLERFAIKELEGATVRRLVYEGDAVEQICGFVKSEDVHLVLLPTHGYGVFRRFLIGSVTAKILHDVACPVLTGVHLDHHAEAAAPFGNVLCAVDLGAHGQSTLAWAAQFAADLKSSLSIVHAAASADRVASAREELKRLQDGTGAESTHVHVQEGDAVRVVCNYAKEREADVIIIGRGARDNASGTLTTKAYAMIRQSPRPVISV